MAGKLKINNNNITPAYAHEDGIDYVPSKTPVVLGHHFAFVAGADPIVGPIKAVTFGWISPVIWILRRQAFASLREYIFLLQKKLRFTLSLPAAADATRGEG